MNEAQGDEAAAAEGAVASGAAEATSHAGDGGASGPGAFELFDINGQADVSLSFWRPREDVFSYSSAHGILRSQATAQDDGAGSPVTGEGAASSGQEATAVAPGRMASDVAEDINASARPESASLSKPLELDDVLNLPVPLSAGADELARAGEVPASEAPQPGRRRAAEPHPSTEDDGEPAHTDDADRATSLGSAFHELARYMVETGSAPDARRVELVAGAYGVGPRDRKRLSAALARWERSGIRAEALSHACLRAEVPFFCEVDSPLGHELEGAIDLLATDAASSNGGAPSALLVDYKTGDHGATYAQIRERHEMQARFYAYVLQMQGYGAITCAFVCVELEDEKGEPVVVRYEFEADDS